MSTIPVICDRCRSIGNSGEGDFSHLGDLLDFTPVERRKRLNGWNAEAQRAFIAALAMTGSKTNAAKSLGRNAFGIDQLLKAEGAESFRLAFDRAIAIAEKNGAMRLATGVADAAARNSWLDKRSALRGTTPDPEPEISADHHWHLIERIGLKFMKKVKAEREARLAGRIVEADFLVRQVTALEVAFDLSTEAFGWDAWGALSNLRRDGRNWAAIVETEFSRTLDQSRRDFWESHGDPPRPEHPRPADVVEQSGGITTAADKSSYGASTTPAEGYTPEQWAEMTTDEQNHARQREWQRAAEQQIRWEEEARQSSPSSLG